jgi:MFS family permease
LPSTVITYKTKLPSGAWLIVGLLCLAGALNYLDRNVITTMRGSIIEAMPMSDSQFGLLTSVFLWTYGLLSPFAGFLADRFKRSRVIFCSLFVWSAVTWLTAYSTTFGQLLVTRVLLGVSEACYIPAALALIVDYHRGTTRSLATGIHPAGIMVGASLGFLGGWIAEKYHWNTPFIIFGIVGIIYSLLLALMLSEAPKTESDQLSVQTESKVSFFEGIKDLFGRGSFILILAYYSLLGVVGWLVQGWLPTYYKEQFSLSQGIAGMYATGLLYPASIVGLILGGFLADRWSRTNPRARILIPVIGLSIAAPFIYTASFTTILPLAIVCFMLYAIMRAFCDSNTMPILCMVVDMRYRATGFGVLNMFATIVGGIGLYAGGVLRDLQVDLSKMYQVAAMIMVVCAVLVAMIKPQSKNSVE